MSILATDDFAGTGALSANWTANDNNSTTMSRSSGQAISDDATSDAAYRWSALAWPADQYSQVILGPATAGLGSGYGACVRMDTAGTLSDATHDTYYRLVGSAGGYERIKLVGAAGTSLESSAATTFTSGDTLYHGIVGTQASFKKNGVEFGSPASDSAIASGASGIGHSSTSAVGDGIASWEGGDFAVAVATLVPRRLALGPKMRRSSPQRYPDSPATPVELTQSPAAPFRPGRGPGKGPMLLRRNLVWPSAPIVITSPDVTIALTGVQATGAVGTLGVALDVAMTGNAATGAVGTLTPGTSLALTGLSATGSVGTLAPSTDVAMTGVAGTGSVGTLAPSTTVTLTGNEATVTIGNLSPSGDVTVALTGVSASALVGDLSPSGGDVVGSADTGSGGGSSLTFDEWLARHPWLRDYELRPNWYAYPPEKKKLRKQIVAAAKERKAVERRLSFAKDRSELDKLLEILNTLQERYNALQELYRAGLAAWRQSRAAEAEEEAEFMEHLINLL